MGGFRQKTAPQAPAIPIHSHKIAFVAIRIAVLG
jgi:hypothetical protein